MSERPTQVSWVLDKLTIVRQRLEQTGFDAPISSFMKLKLRGLVMVRERSHFVDAVKGIGIFI